LLGDGRHVGQRGPARRAGGRDRDELARLDLLHRGQHLDLTDDPDPLANGERDGVEDGGEVATHLALDVDGGDHQLEVLGLHAADEVAERRLERNAGLAPELLEPAVQALNRALAELGRKVTMNVLVHTRHAERFNRLLGESGASHLRLIQVSELDPATMLELSQRLERGEWLAIAGDRVPLHGARIATARFLGQPAAFPQGPWLLAGLLQCPANLLFCLKQGERFHVYLEPFAERIQWRRRDRDAVIGQWVQRYADRLAARCLDAPLQWFNFYPFWNTHEQRHD